jgi:hypothetical protein
VLLEVPLCDSEVQSLQNRRLLAVNIRFSVSHLGPRIKL